MGRPSACSAAFCASSSRSEATSSSRSWLSSNDLGDPGVGAVGLVDDQDHRQVCGQGLAQHEPGLRQRPLRRVDQQQHTVDHRQPALDLAAEVGVAGGVDDVDDRHAAVGVVAVHGGVLGEDRDALFPLQVTGVHQSLDGVVAAMVQGARLAQHRVDQGRLPMVDVCHDGDVPELHAGNCRSAVGQSRKREMPVTWRTAEPELVSDGSPRSRTKFRLGVQAAHRVRA